MSVAIPLAQRGFDGRLVELIDAERLSPAFVAGALGVAFVVGVVHALTPGHGKAVTAAYLVGARGRPKDALLLGSIVSAMHTSSVLALGLALYLLTGTYAAAERARPWLGLTSGLLVLGVGVLLLRRHLRAYRAARRAPEGQGHDHPHVPPGGVSPLSRRGLVLLGISGGLLPSPSAFLVLLTALFTGRTAFGLVLVGMFSIGLAAALTLIGLGVVFGRDFFLRSSSASGRFRRLSALLPLVGAAGVAAGGIYLSAVAILRFPKPF